MKRVRFHFIYTFRFLKYGLVLALVPMARLLFQLDFANFLVALRQDAFILAGMGLVAFLLWRFTHCAWDEDTVEIYNSFVYTRTQRYESGRIAVLEQSRPWYCRLLGATVVTLYFTAGAGPRKRKIYLTKRGAARMADDVLPAGGTPDAEYRVVGTERIWFALLGANVISTLLIGFLGLRQVLDVLGEEAAFLQSYLVDRFYTLEAWFEILLPAGAAVLVTLVALVTVLTLVYSFLHTAGFRARRYGPVLEERCGLIGNTQRRIRLAEVTVVDLRTTPFARLLRRRPVYISAGGYTGNDVPLLLVKTGGDPDLAALVPGYRDPTAQKLADRAPKSLAAFVWRPATVLAVFGLLYLTATGVLPGLLPVLALPCLLAAGSLAAHLEAYFTEGLAAAPGHGVFACYTRFFTRHSLCVTSPMLGLRVSETPLSQQAGRAKVRVYTPSGAFRVRGAGRYTARHMRFGG